MTQEQKQAEVPVALRNHRTLVELTKELFAASIGKDAVRTVGQETLYVTDPATAYFHHDLFPSLATKVLIKVQTPERTILVYDPLSLAQAELLKTAYERATSDKFAVLKAYAEGD